MSRRSDSISRMEYLSFLISCILRLYTWNPDVYAIPPVHGHACACTIYLYSIHSYFHDLFNAVEWSSCCPRRSLRGIGACRASRELTSCTKATYTEWISFSAGQKTVGARGLFAPMISESRRQDCRDVILKVAVGFRVDVLHSAM